jgi:tRNA A-37 threonylcarbamoyl transferase component Bud32
MIGSRLGPYEITAKLGEGGMGVVFRAKDFHLGREVALKVLPAAFTADAERTARFEREAKLLASLNHPNIAQVYGLEVQGDTRALVMELVEGPTLAERLEQGPLPLDESLSLARQIAEALEEAHEKGIVHRDLKPQNIKASIEGKVKVLDFGLAKAMDPLGASGMTPHDLAHSPTVTFGGTREGVILGTAAYMAPEQARGGAVDRRADIWAFGVVLYEMLAGERLFVEGSVVDTLSAVMRKEIDLGRLPAETPPRLRELVRRCLERDPKRRLRDIGEARIALEDPFVVAEVPPSTDSPVAATKRRFVVPLVALGAAVVAAVVTALLVSRSAGTAAPEFRQLTFQRGTITGARFAPDGDTVVYSAAWGGRPSEVFTTRRSGPGARSLGVVDASLLAISKQGELAVQMHPELWANLFHGTLGRVPLGGGAPRQVTEHVQEAEWSDDGASLLVSRMEEGAFRWTIEDSAGKVLHRSENVVLSGMRVSPDGQRLAILTFDWYGVTAPIILLDADGAARELAESPGTGLAWSPAGDEIWYSQQDAAGAGSLWAVDLAGRRRLLMRHAGSLTLRDVASDGTLLVSVDDVQRSVYYSSPALTDERDLAWLDGTQVRDLSADGSTLLLGEFGTAEASGAGAYLRGADGSPAVRLGDGVPVALSPDGATALVVVDDGRTVQLVPTGAGQARTVPFEGKVGVGQAWFTPDATRLAVSMNLADGKTRLASVKTDASDLRQLAPDGFDTFIGEQPLSPDGNWINAHRREAGGSFEHRLFPTDGSLRPRELPGLEPGDVVIRWSGDGRALFVFERDELPARVFRVDVETGERTPWLELMPADPAGVSRIQAIQMTPDGRTYAYNVVRQLSDLYLVRGVK